MYGEMRVCNFCQTECTIEHMKKELITFYVVGDADLKRRIKAEAAARGIDMAVLIREALDSFFAAGVRQNGRSHVGKSKPMRYTDVQE